MIDTFKEALKQKDEEYVKSLKWFTDDIDSLIANMRKQYNDMWDLYKRELMEVESEFMWERGAILDKNAQEIDALFEKQRTKESEYIEKRADLEAE